jgi:ribosomal protein S18 acetylase RimI-like enzyme
MIRFHLNGSCSSPTVMSRTTRPAGLADLDALAALEQRAFTTDRLSRRSFRALLASPTAALIVAERDGRLGGYAVVLFRKGATVARLYSIAVVSEFAGHGIGTALLTSAEGAARRRRMTAMRLEVQEGNSAAIRVYERAHYRLQGREAAYYEDGTAALRYEKALVAGH